VFALIAYWVFFKGETDFVKTKVDALQILVIFYVDFVGNLNFLLFFFYMIDGKQEVVP
jgi:hypothetical protein